jgi:MFS family permease
VSERADPSREGASPEPLGDGSGSVRSGAGAQRARYRAVIRAPGVGWLLGTSLVARLPVAMVSLAIILRVAHASGSYARAGSVTGAYVIGTGLIGPLLGRMADRVGRRPVLLGAAAVNTAGLVTMALVPVRQFGLLLGIAAVTGASLPPVGPAVRSLWGPLVAEDIQASLYAMDATLQEVTFMVGPTLVALIASFASASAALVCCGAIGLFGTVAVAGHSATAHQRRDRSRAPARTPIGSSTLLSLVLISIMFLASIVIVEISVVAFAGRHHAADQAGLLLAVWSAGSMAGGVLFGARTAGGGARLLAPLMLGGAGGFLLLAAAPGVGVLYGLMFVAGVAIAPGFSCIYGIVGAVTPATSSIESFSWVASGIQVGAAIGAAVGGFLVQLVGPRLAFVCAGGCGLATAAFAAWRAHRLTTP